MTDSGDSRDEVAAALAEMVETFGVDRLSTRERVSAMLADRLGSSGTAARREVSLVAAAAGEGVVGELLAGDAVAAVAERFAAATGFTDEAASWAVNVWADALRGPVAVAPVPSQDEPPTVVDPDATRRDQHAGAGPPTEPRRRRTLVWIAVAVVAVLALAGGAAAFGVFDDEIDRLVESCQSGDMAACDELYYATDVGSWQEGVAMSCGGLTSDEVKGFCETRFG